MSESISGMKRSHYCAQLRAENIGEKVCVMGWVQRQRDLGGLIFIDLRDRTGIVQLAFDEAENKALFDKAFPIRGETVLAAAGVVSPRGEGAVNKNLPTGEIEIRVEELRILSAAKTPPFEITENSSVREELRLRHRYLDLRRPDLQRNLMLRYQVGKIARDYFDKQGFLEIETPMMIRSTPEGARDYLIPSRIHQGSFYALPQSPQLYKQLLMAAGYDRYMQIARCFRDEDLRADRQPEFTQIDLEMSFVEEDDVMAVNEGFLQRLFRETLGVEIATPFPRLPYDQAMARYGSDKPDIRFGFELHDLSPLLGGCEFKVFAGAILQGGSVRAINIQGGARFSRKEIDSLTEVAKTYGAKGLAWLKLGEEMSSSFAKFLKEEEIAAILAEMEAQPGDLILAVADQNDVVFDSLGALRCECARRCDLLDPKEYRFLWVMDFPLLEYSPEEERYVAKHHPFTSPVEEDLPLLDTQPQRARARAYDIVLNGVEIGGGSIRIHDQELQNKMFGVLGMSEEERREKFGFLLDAFRYGVPPHGGMAYGFDRLVMLMAGVPGIRDVIAFPKVQNASELMTACPAPVGADQLAELGLAPVAPPQPE